MKLQNGFVVKNDEKVTPCVGVWIEISDTFPPSIWAKPSLPAWECGLKLVHDEGSDYPEWVTPCVGVWIEIPFLVAFFFGGLVTPCVGVWIEITMVNTPLPVCSPSLPAWECGLKFVWYVHCASP